MSVNVAVIPVAGKGTRLLPLTKSVPKELLPLGRKPVLQHVVEELQAAGVHDMVMVTSESKGAIEQHFAADQQLENQLREQGKSDLLADMQFLSSDIACHYVDQQQQLGLGHAVLCAREDVGDRPFLIALGDAKMGDSKQGDAITDETGINTVLAGNDNHASLCRRLVRLFEQSDADVAVSFQQVPLEKVSRYGIADIRQPYHEGDEMFNLTALIEKPSAAVAPSRYAVAARYVCKPVLFDYLQRTDPGHGGEIQLTDAIQAVISDGGRVIGVPLQADEKRYDVGNYETYYSAFIEMALQDPDCGASVKKNLENMLQQKNEKT